jgi:hypothetical protein
VAPVQQQSLDEVTSDESGPAGNQGAHMAIRRFIDVSPSARRQALRRDTALMPGVGSEKRLGRGELRELRELLGDRLEHRR